MCLLEDFEGDLGAHWHGEAIDAGRNAAKVGFVLECSWKFLPCSDILDVAKAGMEFFEHQRELEVTPFKLPCPWLAPYLRQSPKFDFQGETDEGKDFEAGKGDGGCASV